MKYPIALQLYSVREQLKADFKGTLQAVKNMGYDGVEFAGLYGHSYADVKAMCDEVGLKVISAHVSITDMEQGGEELFEGYAYLGCKTIVIPHPGNYSNNGIPTEKLFNFIREYSPIAKKYGMHIAYHNHDTEFNMIEDKHGLDYLYDNTSPEQLIAQLDTCWVNVGGEDPAEYIKKYGNRAVNVHFKDFSGEKGENMYALIGTDGKEQGEQQGEFELRPVGYGVQNFPAMVKALDDTDIEWIIIEMDEPSMGKTRLECAEMGINYLRSI